MRERITGDISKEDRKEIVKHVCNDLGLDFNKVKKDFFKFGSINDTDMLKFAKDNSLEITFDYPENKVHIVYEHEYTEEETTSEEKETPVDEDQGEELPDDW
jgi:hypothetical protein